MKIAIIGSPGSGKTTLSSGLFYYLKTKGVKAEVVPELIKYKVYRKEDFGQVGFDIQNTLEQMALEKVFDQAHKRGEIDHVICEAPLCNGYFYATFYNKSLETSVLERIARDFILSYDKIIFVRPVKNAEYQSFGRVESEEQSRQINDHIESKLRELGRADAYSVTQLTPLHEIVEEILKIKTT